MFSTILDLSRNNAIIVFNVTYSNKSFEIWELKEITQHMKGIKTFMNVLETFVNYSTIDKKYFFNEFMCRDNVFLKH